MRELDPRLTTIGVSANMGMALIMPELVVSWASGILLPVQPVSEWYRNVLSKGYLE